MDEFTRLEAKGLARAKLRARRRRVKTIRARAFVASVALFGVAWAIVFGQLVTGNDPVLGRTARSSANPVAATQRRDRPEAEAAAPPEVEVEPAPEAEPEAEFEPEVEAAAEFEEEVEPEPEPEPVITSSS